MKKYFLFPVVATLLTLKLFSQSSDTITIETLKKRVPYLKDTDKVNCLNQIAYAIMIMGAPGSAGFIGRADSEYRYASLAYVEAKKRNYRKGMAYALLGKAHSEQLRGFGLRWEGKNDSATVIAQNKYSSDAIILATEINDNDVLGRVYMAMDGRDKSDTTDYMKKSIDYFRKAGSTGMEGEACTWVAEGYLYKGYYENAFEYSQQGLLLNRKALDQARTKEEQEWRNYLYQQSLADVAALYKEAGDYQISLEYLNEANQFGLVRSTGWDMGGEKAEIFRNMGEYDSSFYYLRKDGLQDRFTKQDIGATFLMAKQYDSALALFNEVLPEFRKINRANGVILVPILFYIGSAYAGKNEYTTALTYAREGLTNALKRARRPDMMNEYELLSRIYHRLGNNDSAYQYLLKYFLLKDSLQNRQFLFRLNNSKKLADEAKKESRISLLNRDNKIKEQQLKRESLVRNFLFAGIIAFMIIGVSIFRTLSLKRKNEKLQLQNELERQRLENEKKHAELKQQAIELEMQALRAQMNPHFIFNCLSSINRFIFKNETRAASDYLTRFSRLIRMVLMHSQKKLIPLEDELEMLRLYLDMERLRFKNAFDYSITTTNAIESTSVFIPPLLLQPFCENAIWHGLMHKEGHGHLNISISEENKVLHCIIEDDGVGREKAAALKSKSAEETKSLGLQITTKRLALLNGESSSSAFYKIDDIVNENGEVGGTKVSLAIRYKESVEEIA